ncbi:DNA-binding transcriptional regulator, IclR family [Modicisalibacter muralis]|uniref:DNA-binding transcriptional regulator, IclR family n=1 Tax=Modicisalibacter muralis TaxID=119000 RepID=A0A1G9QF60_9GAMM|nr:DNA-binding transcriptional regulator, IclR family [Halomonas muralis]
MHDAYLYDGIRTPFGRHGGALAGMRPDDLLGLTLKRLVERSPFAADAFEDVLAGCTNQAGEDSRNVAGQTVNRLGAGVLVLGYRYLASQGIRDIARPHMQRLADATDCAIALGTADRVSMTYVEVCQGSGPLVMRLETGSRISMATTAIGRAWLCGISAERRNALMADMRQRDPDNWPATEQSISKSLDDYASYGFCLSEGDWEREVSAVAMPLILEEGAEVMAINCGGSSLRLSHRVLVENLGPRLKDLIEQIKGSLKPPRIG